MKTTEIFKEHTVLSFEVFPSKRTGAVDTIYSTLEELQKLHPDFISVTYGAGGSENCKATLEIASAVKNNYHIESVAHLPCIGLSKEDVLSQIRHFKEAGIENILALRGDIPKDEEMSGDFRYAGELIAFIRERCSLNVIAACYPEGHVESVSKTIDMDYLKQKVEAGCDFVTTQMFFDNNILYNYLYRIREKGITVPVVAGIMPVTNVKQIIRSCQLSGTYLPSRFKAIVDRFGDNPAAMKQAGIAYATEQIIDLIANGVDAIHVYSMNKPDVAAKIKENLSEIL